MALQPFRLRRAVTLSFSILHHSLHYHKPLSSISSHLLTPRTAARTAPSFFAQSKRPFTSTTALSRRVFDPETEEIGPDTILFEGCDYNHWLITVDFKDHPDLTRDQMIDTYVNIAAQVFGSVEEAKKKIYALSTTTYQGFQVLCSEEISEKFKGIPGVVFVLPDSYIDPVNKEYGGDKYVNGEIFPRAPPVQYGRRNINQDRRREETSYQRNAGYDNRGPPPRQNYGPSPQQNYGPPPRQSSGPLHTQNSGLPPPQNSLPPRQNIGQPEQNYGPPPQQNYGPPQEQNYEPPPQQNYGPPPQQNYGPPPQQNYGPPPQQNYGPTSQQNYGTPQRNYRPPQPSYAPRPQQSYDPPPQQQRYGNSPNFSAYQNYSPPGSGERRDFNKVDHGNHYNQGQQDLQQGNLQSHVMPEQQRGFSPDASYESSQGGSFGHLSGGQRNFSSVGSY